MTTHKETQTDEKGNIMNVPQYQPQFQPQYQPQQYGPPARQDDGPKGFAITSMVLGIVSLVIPYGGILTAILAIIFGAVSRRKNDGGRGMAIAGLVCGIVALVLWVVVILIVVSVVHASNS